MNRDAALPLALELVELFRPACARIEIAGSLRREKPEVHDAEIVAVPLPTEHTNLLGEIIPYAPRPIEDAITALICKGWATMAGEVQRDGRRYKRIYWRPAEGRQALPVDLFLPDADSWGNVYAIRTGSAAFSKWFMTARRFGGGMPDGYRQRGGYLWDERPLSPIKIPCAEENDFFRHLGLPVLPPPQRNEDGIEYLRRHLRG